MIAFGHPTLKKRVSKKSPQKSQWSLFTLFQVCYSYTSIINHYNYSKYEYIHVSKFSAFCFLFRSQQNLRTAWRKLPALPAAFVGVSWKPRCRAWACCLVKPWPHGPCNWCCKATKWLASRLVICGGHVQRWKKMWHTKNGFAMIKLIEVLKSGKRCAVFRMFSMWKTSLQLLLVPPSKGHVMLDGISAFTPKSVPNYRCFLDSIVFPYLNAKQMMLTYQNHPKIWHMTMVTMGFGNDTHITTVTVCFFFQGSSSASRAWSPSSGGRWPCVAKAAAQTAGAVGKQPKLRGSGWSVDVIGAGTVSSQLSTYCTVITYWSFWSYDTIMFCSWSRQNSEERIKNTVLLANGQQFGEVLVVFLLRFRKKIVYIKYKCE